MKCKNCGAELRETDTFCPKCGEKVNFIDTCPFCGEKLREGALFCPKCGKRVGEEQEEGRSSESYEKDPSENEREPEDDDIPVSKLVETKDIPFDDIEKNIIFETKQQVKSRDFKSGSDKESSRKRGNGEAVRDHVENHNGVPEDHHEKGPENHSEENRRERYAENPEDHYDHEKKERYNKNPKDRYDKAPQDRFEYERDNGYDEDTDQDARTDKMIVPIVIVAILIVAVIAVLFVKMKGLNGSEEAGTASVAVSSETDAGSKAVGKIEIISDVNIRNKPSKDGSDVIGKAKAGESFDYYGYGDDSKNWVTVKLDDGSTGYIYKDYVKVVK